APLLVEHFMPRSRHPKLEIVGALVAAVAVTYGLAAALRHLPQEVSPHPSAFFPSPQQLLPGGLFLVSLFWYRRRLTVEDSSFDRTMYADRKSTRLNSSHRTISYAVFCLKKKKKKNEYTRKSVKTN